jgi:hypothetical protein
MRKRADWSRALPRPLVIPEVITLKALADVRTLMNHLAEDRLQRQMWRHVALQLKRAAADGDTTKIFRLAPHGAVNGRRRMPAAMTPRRFPTACRHFQTPCLVGQLPDRQESLTMPI